MTRTTLAMMSLLVLVGRPANAQFDLFESGRFAAHSAPYDSIHLHPLYDPAPFPKALVESQWQARFIALALAWQESDSKDRLWFKRAMELAAWKSLESRAGQKGYKGDLRLLFREQGLPDSLQVDEQADVEALGKSLSRAEAMAEETHQEGAPKCR